MWRILDFRFSDYPQQWVPWLLGTAVYVNFFTNRWIIDLRYGLFALTALLFWRTRIHFRNWREHCWMPLLMLISFVLVALVNPVKEPSGSPQG